MSQTASAPSDTDSDRAACHESSLAKLTDPIDLPTRRRRRAAPPWLISLLTHAAFLLTLAWVTVTPPKVVVNVLTAIATDDAGVEMKEFSIAEAAPEPSESSERSAQPVDLSDVMRPTPVETMELVDPTIDLEPSELAEAIAPTAAQLQRLSQFSMASLSGRSGDTKQQMLKQFGGTRASEAAVTEALKWLARHQMDNGAWTFQHDAVCKRACGDPGTPRRASAFNAATGLALLPFLGAGQTHQQGDYKDTVFRGLRFLINNGRKGKKSGRPVLDLSESFVDVMPGNMYSHGFATIALCEAYAMTRDADLKVPAQNAINFVLYAQCGDGGWRYLPRDASGGDTSVTGWMVMALKSGSMGKLEVPKSSISRSMNFLNKVQSNGGAWYGYVHRETEIIPSCTAIGLLCRMYAGWGKGHRGLAEGVAAIGDVGVLQEDLYYDYYAAQVLRHFGGPSWDTFNSELRDWLVETQSQRGDAKGSWYFADCISIFEGGRLANTAFATMILEVYYRHMPLYAEAAADDPFPL